jgi:hypothetical protein
MPMPFRVTSLIMLASLSAAHAEVQLVLGPTPIVDGDAALPGDITVMNEKLAFGIAVESAVPYGVPRGALVDVAPVVDGKPGRDRVVFADFIPDNWSAWPNTGHRVDVIERGPQQVVVRAVRDWGEVTIATTYSLRAGADRIEMRTTMTNEGDRALHDLASGQTLWPRAGSYFEVPGTTGLPEGAAVTAISDRATAYDEDWALTLHAPYLDYVGSRSKDLLQKHTLQPGESRSFDAWLQVGASGDLAPVVATEIERKRLTAGAVHGLVSTRDGKAVAKPVVVVMKQGVPYAWTIGHEGRYAWTCLSVHTRSTPRHRAIRKAGRPR